MKRIKIGKSAAIISFCAVAAVWGLVIVLHHNPLAVMREEITKNIISCVILAAACLLFGLLYDKITVLPVELYQNRRLIWKLAKNDFKKRYAGSYLGAVWAMIQPVVTVFMYWFVFDKLGFMRGGTDVPYVLFLTAGLVPWFYFSEALTNGTMALLEYNYLVKKVVFKISILPIIKIIGATFIHAFFIAVMLIISCIYGYFPTLYTLQIFYYSFCLFIFVLALCYTTCAVVVFFRDLSQIINIILQIGMWATPILWNIESIEGIWLTVFKINPLVYIVSGYRSALYGREWFWQDFYSTVYFWIVTVVLFLMGAVIFKRLKVHFADVM